MMNFLRSRRSGLSVVSIIRQWNHRFNSESRTTSIGRKFYHQAHGDGLSLTSAGSMERTIFSLPEAKVLYCLAPSMGHHAIHQESNIRIPAIVNALERSELTSEFRGSEVFQIQDFQPASTEDILSVHSRSYLEDLEKAMDKASDEGIIIVENSGPTYATKTTLHDSLVAAGAGLILVDAVVAASKISMNPPTGFALIRPPGNHALPKGPMEFCFFGNISVAARYVQRVHGLRRVLILDFDVHHGNGTSDVFYDDPDVFVISTHQDGIYPHTGKVEHIGQGSGEGTTLNLPLPHDSGDNAFRFVFDEVIVPCAQRFKPDIILVSAGYGGHASDGHAGLQLTTDMYHTLASNIKQLAKELCEGRCVFFLEGGFYLNSLMNSVAATFQAFLGEPSSTSKFDFPLMPTLSEEPIDIVKKTVEKVKHLHSL